jgi:hypothetical protein
MGEQASRGDSFPRNGVSQSAARKILASAIHPNWICLILDWSVRMVKSDRENPFRGVGRGFAG